MPPAQPASSLAPQPAAQGTIAAAPSALTGATQTLATGISQVSRQLHLPVQPPAPAPAQPLAAPAQVAPAHPQGHVGVGFAPPYPGHSVLPAAPGPAIAHWAQPAPPAAWQAPAITQLQGTSSAPTAGSWAAPSAVPFSPHQYNPPVAPATPTWAGIRTSAFPASPLFGGAICASSVPTPPPQRPVLGHPLGPGVTHSWLQRLRFLGASTFSGRTGYSSAQHPCFTVPGAPPEFRLSRSGTNNGPFDAAPKEVIIIPDIVDHWTMSFGRNSTSSSQAISSHVSRYDRFHRHDADAAMRQVQPDCGFFSNEIFDPMCHGCILASMDIPSATRISQSLSVFSFLRMRPGSDNTSQLPADGWETPDAAVTFLSAIQWFITDLFGPRIAPSSFMYIALDYLKARIQSHDLLQAWTTIDHRAFSAVILFHVHSLWVSLIHWSDDCERLDIYYRHSADILMIAGAAPFSVTIQSLDNTLATWITFVDSRFPRGMLNLANSFTDIIPRAWDHIFLGSEDASPPPRRASAGERSRRQGDADRPGSRAWAHNVFEKVAGHRDASRGRNANLVSAIRPFPKIKMHSGESLEICFGWSCKGCQCINSRSTCAMLHMSTRDPDLINASRSSMSTIRDWLQRPNVKARVCLTDAARRLSCFR